MSKDYMQDGELKDFLASSSSNDQKIVKMLSDMYRELAYVRDLAGSLQNYYCEMKGERDAFKRILEATLDKEID